MTSEMTDIDQYVFAKLVLEFGRRSQAHDGVKRCSYGDRIQT